jgi:hypothetical protein
VLSESEEYFNTNEEFDVTRLNIAKPGELFKVRFGLPSYDIKIRFSHRQIVPPTGGIDNRTTFTRLQVASLLHKSDWVYVIG